MQMFAIKNAVHPIESFAEAVHCARYIKEIWDIPAPVEQVGQFVAALALKAREMTEGYFHHDYSSVSSIDIKVLNLKADVMLGELNFKDKFKDECEAFNADFVQILKDTDYIESFPWLHDVSPKQGLTTDQNFYDELFKGFVAEA
ncbi:hypothetical protein [Vibrio crassostreae]|uniref:hypothetical protein n=1 Tax=Vibrio crassostreae TaxID=246167 RepID=UPI001B305F60|nr:hypothetical protein [Vibrio crassostreae]